MKLPRTRRNDIWPRQQEYLRNLRQNCMMEYESWNRYFGSIRNSIDYQVLDDNGSILMNYAKNRNILSDDDYVFRVVMHTTTREGWM